MKLLQRFRRPKPRAASPIAKEYLLPPYDRSAPLTAFLLDVVSLLGIEAYQLFRFGATTYLECDIGSKPIQVATNGSVVWIKCPLWPDFWRYESVVLWAKEASYRRLKFLEGGETPHPTGNSEFDRSYLIFGEYGSLLAQDLSKSAEELLLQYNDMIVDIMNGEVDFGQGEFVREPHLRIELVLHDPDDDTPGVVRVGERRFTPEYVCKCLRRSSTFGQSLEPLQPLRERFETWVPRPSGPQGEGDGHC